MDITSFKCNQILAKAEYEFTMFNGAATMSFIGIEEIQSGGAVDRIVQFLKMLIHNVKKIVIAIYNFVRDRFRRDLSMYNQVKSYAKTIGKMYGKLDPKKRDAIDAQLASMQSAATWTKNDQLFMIDEFKKACMYSHSTILEGIDQNIDNIFSEPDWFKDMDELSTIGIKVNESGHISTTAVVRDSDNATFHELGYMNIIQVLSVVNNYDNMFNDYKETQKLSLKLMDLERKLDQQKNVVEKDSLIEESVKQYTTLVSTSVNDGITFVKSLTGVLMNMFINITRRYMIVLSTSYKLLTTSK